MTSDLLDLLDRLRRLDVPDDGRLRPPRFDSVDVAYAVHDTSVGRILLACNDSGALVGSLYTPDDATEEAVLDRIATTVSPRVLRQPARLDEARRQLDDYLAGRRRDFELALDLSLTTAFQAEVLGALAARVGYGEHTAYGALAQWIGRPRAARAVGTALGANPLCIVLPCHRVIGARGSLTGYAGGLAAKRQLLDLESGGSDDDGGPGRDTGRWPVSS